MATDNKSIGRFILDGLLPAPRGMPQIEVAFDIDANGILSVSAKDKGTGKEQKIVIEASSGLSKEQVEEMVREGESHAEEDRRRKAEVETRNQADNLVYNTEKLLADNADKVPEDLKREVEEKLTPLKTAIEANDVAGMQTAMTGLNEALQKLGQAVYSQSGGPGAGGPQQPGAAPPNDSDPGTVEGEFKEVN